MRKYRPQGFRGPGDAHLPGLARQLLQVLRDAQAGFAYDSLRLRKTELARLAEILVEFAEDIHNEIGIWTAYEAYNRELFGVLLPFATKDDPPAGVSVDRVRHLLWVVYPQLSPGLILSPRHQDLERLAQAAACFLDEAFHAVPKGSGVAAFLRTSNRYGWEVKRKLVWLGSCSYMFRLFLADYLEAQNRGRWDIGHVDDFLCQECTLWSGLGAIDILAGVLDISAADRLELRGWHERHAAFYRIVSAGIDYLEAQNVISDKPYRIRIDGNVDQFKPGNLVFGSLVSWRGDWYWSGEQEIWTNTAGMDAEGLRDTMKRKSPEIVCRFWKEYEEVVRQRAEELHQASLAYHGKDLVVYPDGLSMAADWQQEIRSMWEARPPDEIEQLVKKHQLKDRRPDMKLPRDLLEHRNGIGVFLNDAEGKEILCNFNFLVEGLQCRGEDLSREQEDAIRSFIRDDAVSPGFVRRVLSEHGDESARTAFRLPLDAPAYWLDYLMRAYKGHFYRKRYPSISVV